MSVVSSHDAFVSAHLSESRISVGLVITTDVTQAMTTRHSLRGGAALALSRLASAAALVRFLPARRGTLSLQVVCDGPLRQLFVDVDDQGFMRGYCKSSASVPLISGPGRASVAAAVGKGLLSVLRQDESDGFARSTTDLVTGEIDTDVEHFASHSEQVASILICDAVWETEGNVRRAGGFLAQALPDARPDALEELRESITPEFFVQALGKTADVESLLHMLIDHAQPAAAPQPLRWHCRCSDDRVVQALRMLSADDVQDMLAKNETAKVECDFCSAEYAVEPARLREIFNIDASL